MHLQQRDVTGKITSHTGCIQQIYIMDCTKLIMEYSPKMSSQIDI